MDLQGRALGHLAETTTQWGVLGSRLLLPFSSAGSAATFIPAEQHRSSLVAAWEASVEQKFERCFGERQSLFWGLGWRLLAPAHPKEEGQSETTLLTILAWELYEKTVSELTEGATIGTKRASWNYNPPKKQNILAHVSCLRHPSWTPTVMGTWSLGGGTHSSDYKVIMYKLSLKWDYCYLLQQLLCSLLSLTLPLLQKSGGEWQMQYFTKWDNYIAATWWD